MNGQRAEAQIKRSVDVRKWNNKKECAVGKDRQSQELNHYIDTVRARILQIHRELEMDGKRITAEIIKQHFYGENNKHKMLLEVFNEHNKKCRDLLGKDYMLGTVLRYERTVTYLLEYMKKDYRVSDLPMRELDQAFITGFEHFIKTEKACAQNATVKYLKNLKRITRIALANKWMDTDPFFDIQFKYTPTNREFLVEEEIRLLLEKKFTIPRLEIVRDIFVFCCLSGLTFTYVQHLRAEHIFCDNKGEYWIRKP